ncbi:MAG: 4Fe-4S dicluster domain-containing protein [Deltaproteobacteria bacterium]|nr:4Fe-4S dicluster domain-containing protein [Deltaproteobacteria bacterium]
MNHHYITLKDFNLFLTKLVNQKIVYGPVARKNKFVFDLISSPEQLRLDYDVTILPPKKIFFPPKQHLLHFDGESYKDCLDPKEQIIMGVHNYDIKAIDQLDFLFKEKNPDDHYLLNRRKTTIIGSNIQTIAARSFWGSAGAGVEPKGHDGFLTKLKDGFVFETRTKKAENLVKFAKFIKAKKTQVEQAAQINTAVKKKCPAKLAYSSAEIAIKTRLAFKNNELWERLSKDCFSCGSCNTTCATCYCFDVQDSWNLDQKSGFRTRYWDSCMTVEFAKTSLGGGAVHNFRALRRERFRHRVMRKLVYLNDKLGGPACVGCGRCATACTADIADPVNIVKEIMEA